MPATHHEDVNITSITHMYCEFNYTSIISIIMVNLAKKNPIQQVKQSIKAVATNLLEING
jgi:hypothetical protein